MYTQAFNTSGVAAPSADPEREARFQARVDAEAEIEPNDWMPEADRRTLASSPSAASTECPLSRA